MRLSIIGTAGRGDDLLRLDASGMAAMTDFAGRFVDAFALETGRPAMLVSGGAAWADHVAVRLYLQDRPSVEGLELHFPAPFLEAERRFAVGGALYDPGYVANMYHARFSQREKARNSLAEIAEALRKGAIVTVSAGGFKARNGKVAQTDCLLAFTFGNAVPGESGAKVHATRIPAGRAGLKDGGTAHTWDRSEAPARLHVNLPVPENIDAAELARQAARAANPPKEAPRQMAMF